MSTLMEFFSGASVQEKAAYVAGAFAVLAAVLGALFTYRIHRERMKADRDLNHTGEVRKHMVETYRLVHRVSVSFGRLAQLAPTLDEDGMLTETTNTLDVYAEYTQHLTPDRVISYPADLKEAITGAQKAISRLFLDLRRGKDDRQLEDFAKLMGEDADRLKRAVAKVAERIEARIRVEI
jgi:hypothetical protein